MIWEVGLVMDQFPIKVKDGKFIDDEPVFKFDWHAKALAVTLASASVGKWSIDKGRF